jgi:chlorophyllide a reductase subunit Y
MDAFFSGVGEGHAAGVWETLPKDRPEFREQYKRKMAKAAKAANVEEPI